MIGHFLQTLTTEQEDRVLQTAMRPGHWKAPCLLGVVHPRDGSTKTLAKTNGTKYHVPGCGYHAWTNEIAVATSFDNLCARFGIPRITAAIRDRILSNRARRILQNAPVSRDTEVVESVR